MNCIGIYIYCKLFRVIKSLKLPHRFKGVLVNRYDVILGPMSLKEDQPSEKHDIRTSRMKGRADSIRTSP
jgi:hypothetical protein